MSTDNANSVYVDLLKKSEKYCEQNNLTTASDLLAVIQRVMMKILMIPYIMLLVIMLITNIRF